MSARRLTALLAVSIAVGAGASSAFGYWTGFDTPLQGAGAGEAGSVNQGAAPTAESNGTSVVLSWGASSLTTGEPVDGYIVKRYDATTDVLQAILTNCSGTVAATTCTELGMPQGEWKYTVTPVFAANWKGAESAHSGVAQTGPSVLQLNRPVVGPPLPTEMTGTLTGFVAGEGITFELDGAPISGSPATVDAGGDAAIGSLTIPAGIGDGPHTISVIGDDPDVPSHAEASFLVDTTPPTVTTFTTPAPNAAGWNNTSPVQVNGTADDGNGSGVAFGKYTDDGTDPKTSPTAQFAIPPIIASATTTYKFYAVDVAGNETAVQTHEVKIDTMPPVFTTELVDVTGNIYSTPTGPQGQPGTTYYRGAAAGSFRIELTPVPMGGSPAISAGFTDLPADSIGWSFDSSSVTTPEGGPYKSNVASWVAGSTSTPAGTISLTNAAGTSFGSSGALNNDSTGPSGGSVDASGLTGTDGRYSTSINLTLNLAKGTDAGAGLADGSAPADLPSRLLRASAPLTSGGGTANGTCGTYGAYTQVGSDDPAATFSDTVPTDGACYRYRYVVSDHLTNTTTYESPDIKVDSTAPTGGSVTYTNGYSTAATLSVSFTKGTDTGSGVDAGSGLLQRSSATLTNNVCGTFSAFATVATNPTSPMSNAQTTGNCYQYRYLVSNNVGNQATYTSASIVKVDTVAPTNSLSLTSAVGASLTGNTLYYKSNAAGSFRFVNAVADAASGPASTTYPWIFTSGWSNWPETISTPAGGPYTSSTISWTASPSNPFGKTVTGRDNAGLTVNTTVTFASDTTAPAGGSIAYTNGVVNATSVPVTLANGTDAGSGIGTTTVERDVAPLTTATETCGVFPGTFATTVTLVGGADTSVSSGNCYRYRYVVDDKVGNETTYTSASVAKVDTSGPRVTAIASRQSSGFPGDGRLQVGDKLILTFNQALSAASVPASFTGATEISPGSFVNVTLTIPGITNGARGTGSPFYMSAPSTTATFGGTTALVNNGTATTVTVTVTSLSGSATAASSGTLVFAPAATITDGGGNSAAGTFSTLSGFELF